MTIEEAKEYFRNGNVYRHIQSGNLYFIVDVAVNKDSDKESVIYKNSDCDLFVRNIDDFLNNFRRIK